MSRYTVDVDRILDFADRLVQFDRRAEQIATEADQQVAALHESWRGDAADGHQDYHQRWMAGVEQMREALDELRTKVDTVHRSYSGAVDLNTAMWP